MRFTKIVRHWIWVAPLVLGVIFVAAGIYTYLEGRDAKNTVHDQIVAEQITTAEDSAIPGVLVDDADTAQAQADAIQKHTLTSTGGKTYSQLERFVSADGQGTTNDAKAALIGADGKPVANPLRNTAFQGAALRTALNEAVIGFKLSDLVMGIGVFMLVIGGTFIVFIAPAVYYSAEVANHYEEIIKREKKEAPGTGTVMPA